MRNAEKEAWLVDPAYSQATMSALGPGVAQCERSPCGTVLGRILEGVSYPILHSPEK